MVGQYPLEVFIGVQIPTRQPIPKSGAVFRDWLTIYENIRTDFIELYSA